jgi:hypothetical protein
VVGPGAAVLGVATRRGPLMMVDVEAAGGGPFAER